MPRPREGSFSWIPPGGGRLQRVCQPTRPQTRLDVAASEYLDGDFFNPWSDTGRVVAHDEARPRWRTAASRACLAASIASPVLVTARPSGPAPGPGLAVLAPAWRMSESAVMVLVGMALAFLATALVFRRILTGRWGPRPTGLDPGPGESPGLEAGAWMVGVLGLETSLMLAVLPPTALSSGGALWHAVRIPLYGWLAGLSLPLLVTVHELGHAAVARLVGLGTDRLQVGPLAFHRTPDGVRAEWRPIAISGVLGFLLPAPVEVDRMGTRMAAVALGGPIASLAVGAALLAAAPGAGATSSFGGGVARYLPWVAGWASVAMGVTSLVPRRVGGGLSTDGALFLRSLGRASPATQIIARFRLAWREGTRPRAWGIDAREALAAGASDADSGRLLALVAASVALDTGEFELASGILADALRAADLPPGLRPELELQEIMLEAFLGRPDVASQRLLAGAGRGLDSGYVALARAVVAATGGQPREAVEELAFRERYLAGQVNPAQVRVGNEWAEERLRALLAGDPGAGATGDL